MSEQCRRVSEIAAALACTKSSWRCGDGEVVRGGFKNLSVDLCLRIRAGLGVAIDGVKMVDAQLRAGCCLR